ncbi:MAG: Cupin 2 conserved barrel domain protein [Candidatus Saccharibacteria bacterium]|nr:Cupin 2 conserved barrel domain protein [Candidatus Saccharibacteria bacterium]
MFAAKNITSERWTAESDEVFAPRAHALDRKLWCAEGSIIFTVDGKKISLQAGDALDIPAYTVHEALGGFSGCAIYESPVPAVNPAILQV